MRVGISLGVEVGRTDSEGEVDCERFHKLEEELLLVKMKERFVHFDLIENNKKNK